MQHEFLPLRVKREIAKISSKGVEATFSGGDFAPDLMRRMHEHLRKIEEAQVRAVQEYKEVVRTSTHRGGRLSNNVQAQIDAARKAQT